MFDVAAGQLDIQEKDSEVLGLVPEERHSSGIGDNSTRRLAIGARAVTIVGLTGKAGAGKTTAAEYLRGRYGFRIVSLADPIKDILNERFNWLPMDWEDREWKEKEDPKFGRRRGEFWQSFSPRSWAQWLGTEVGRKLYPDCWVDACLSKINGEVACGYSRFVIPDCRFDNEALAVNEYGGVVIEVVSDLPTTPSAHSSEAGIRKDLIEYDVCNLQGKPEKLLDELDLIMFLEGIKRVQ